METLDFKFRGKQFQRGIGYDSPVFHYNLFVVVILKLAKLQQKGFHFNRVYFTQDNNAIKVSPKTDNRILQISLSSPIPQIISQTKT